MSRFRKLGNKILFFSDRPEDLSGLAKISRDLASLCCTMPEFKVGFLGRGSQGMSKFPWTTFSYPESTGGWGHQYLAGVADDFFGKDYGIVFTNWDISRLGWLTGQGLPDDLAKAYGSGKNWEVWAYPPVDSCGVSGVGLGVEARYTLSAFKRVLAPSEWGANVLRASGRPDADWIPHALNLNTFKPDPEARKKLGWNENDVIVGMVATNQARKDYPVAFECLSLLRKQYGNKFRAWVHTDTMLRHWNIAALAADYGIGDCLEVSLRATDEELAMRYAACDCTILPSGGEGFSYTTAESLACGTPQIVADHAAAQELVEELCRVRPVAYRIDTIHNVQRAVLSGHAFANAAFGQIEKKREDSEYRSEQLRDQVQHLSWDKLKTVWERWFREGLR